MDYYTPQSTRRHNPVDSICRKLQTIQWRGDREPNSPFQIPKLSSSSYDSPQCGLRHNLEAILKKGALHRDEGERVKGRGIGMPSSAPSQRSSQGRSVPMSTPACNPSVPANVTYTITSTLGDRRGADGSDLKHVKTWQRYCSTPTSNQTKDSPYFTFTKGPQSVQPESERPSRSPSLSRTFTPGHSTFSYNLNFSSADTGTPTECELPYPALVVKRLSLGDGGNSLASENRKENMAEISLICEENLLDTIFHACDTQRRGKVYVSHIVDYLRHTTSRSSEDSGLEELCNMLDPEHKDVSIDLDTYHAVMKEWIDDCRNNRYCRADVEDEHGAGEPVPGNKVSLGSNTVHSRHIWDEPSDDNQDAVKLRDGLSAKRSVLLNMTSGSLEAFGGEVSRAEFETSELVYCVADLQMSNQKLQEEVKKLKQVVEGMEDSNQKLAEENEELRNQARMHQQLAQKEKMLKDEVEEMKATLSCTEEGRARASAHSKNVEKENQRLFAKIASLQDENFKVTMEMDELQRRIAELCDLNADLQVQIHSFDAVVSEKEAQMQENSRQINELRATVEEYSSITELLRADKFKLENQMQMMHPDLAGAGLSLSVAYRLNQSTSGSLQTELALAQSPLEAAHGVDHLSTTMSLASPLDETLDKEVLLMMQGPSPEHMALEFRSLLHKLKREFKEETSSVWSTLKVLLGDPGGNTDSSLQRVQAELDTRSGDWALSLDQLAQYTDSLEKELIKMASNMRRSRTEILHLSVRVQEQESQKQQLYEELEQLKTPQDGREASCQTPAPEEEPGNDLEWEEEFALQDFLKNEIAMRNCRAHDGRLDCRTEAMIDKVTEEGEEEDGEEKWTVVDSAGAGEGRDTSTPLHGPGAVGDGQGPSMARCKAGLRPCRELSNPSFLCLHEQLAGRETENQSANVFINATLAMHDSTGCTESEPELNCQPLQEEAAAPLSAHSQAVSTRQPEVDAPPDLSHSENHNAPAHNLSISPKEDPTVTPAHLPPVGAKVVPADSVSPGPGGTHIDSIQLTSDDHRGEEEKDGEADSGTAQMSCSKSLSQDQSADRSAAEDSTSLLPALVEEEESMQDGAAEAPPVVASMAGAEQLSSSGVTALSDASCPQSGSASAHAHQSGSTMGSMTSDPSQLEDNASAEKKDSLTLLGKNKKELRPDFFIVYAGGRQLADQERRLRFETKMKSHWGGRRGCNMEVDESEVNEQNGDREAVTFVRTLQELTRSVEAMEELKVQGGKIETCRAAEQESQTSMISDCDSDKNSLTQNDKEIETEFQRLALGFKCDMFTLEKRLRLEERSRDLAEENVRREVSSCQGLLQALTPLCEDDIQSMEIIQRLQKNLDILIQSMTRVSSRSEMLGAIHQESRIGKAVEVMIQHVENLRRMYTKEHAELLELRETLMQNERSFGSQTERDDFRGKKLPTSQYYKSSGRRVSIATIPRSGGNMHFDMPKSQDGSETEADRLTRRSPWSVTGKSMARPPLKRFISSAAWVDTEEPSLMMKGTARDTTERQSADEQKEEPEAERRRSSLSELGSKLTSLILPLKMSQDELFVMLPSPSSSPMSTDAARSQSLSHSLTSSRAAAAAVARGNRGLWLWLAMVVVLAGLLALLASLVMQPAVDAAPVGTGDSWMTIQQLLWPYTGLRHNGQPPV
ncbi:inositol 1,4,5-triphosphate receptor associated 2 [Aulostomus maculatus]